MPYVDDGLLYEKLGIEKDNHIIISFHYKKLSKQDGSRVTLPKPGGLSGSGLWAITSNGCHYLIGIMKEYNLEQSYLVAIRIDIVTELMRHVFYSDLPSSNITPTKWFLDNSIPNEI